jgi:hypothetical protein
MTTSTVAGIHQRRKHTFAAVATFIICIQLQLIQMAQNDDVSQKETKENASWNDNEVNTFLDYLITQQSKIAGTTFKDPTFADAAKKIVDLRTSGAVKAMVHCKSKFANVCYLPHQPLRCIIDSSEHFS